MAELLSQSEIDDLLSSTLGEDSDPMASAGDMGGDVPAAPSGRQKIFKPPKKTIDSFKYEYRSPVIKRNNIVLNPMTDSEAGRDKIVVRSLANYADFLRRKKSQEA